MIRLATFVLVTMLSVTGARAESGRAALGDVISKLATAADAIANAAKTSDDRGVRKKFAPKATEISDDLAALARRAVKDVPMKTIAEEVGAIDKDATALIDLADDADDKAERKTLRAQATALEAAVAGLKKTVEAGAKTDDAAKPAKLPTITADSYKRLVAAVTDANTDADKLAIVRQAVTTNSFPVAHVAYVMDLFNTEAPKVDAATFAWPNLVDPQNGFQLFAKLELAGSKAELHRRIGK